MKITSHYRLIYSLFICLGLTLLVTGCGGDFQVFNVDDTSISTTTVASIPASAFSSITNKVSGAANSKQLTLTIIVKDKDNAGITGITAEKVTLQVAGAAAETLNTGHFSSFTEVGNGVYTVIFTGDVSNTTYNLTNLTLSEVVLESGPTAVKTPPAIIAHYAFEDNTQDSSVNNNHGTDNNLTYSAGTTGQAASFNGVNSWFVMPLNLIRGNPNFTVVLRFKTTNKGVLLGYQNAAVNGGPAEYVPLIYVGNDGKLYGSAWTGASMSIISASAVNDGNWHKVAYSSGATSISLYLDDTLIETKNNGNAINHLAMSFNQLGYGAGAQWPQAPVAGWFPYTGLIDEFYLFDGDATGDTILSY